jgi:hypothetical protein
MLLLLALTWVESLMPANAWHWRGSWGRIHGITLATTAVAMFAGGLVAGSGFRAAAPALVALAWLASLASAWLMAPDTISAPARLLLRDNLPTLALTLVTAWAAAFAGERLAARRRVAG